MEFQPYPKTPRFVDDYCVITEKINGTNSQVVVDSGRVVQVGSRNRPITPASDNFGFAAWVDQHRDELATFLGDGRHYGEWAGPGVQKNPLDLPRRTWFLFNVQRHDEDKFDVLGHLVPDVLPVPVLYKGPFSRDICFETLSGLLTGGTYVGRAGPRAAPPEGVVISIFGVKLKMTGDPRPKGER